MWELGRTSQLSVGAPTSWKRVAVDSLSLRFKLQGTPRLSAPQVLYVQL